MTLVMAHSDGKLSLLMDDRGRVARVAVVYSRPPSHSHASACISRLN